MTNKHSKRNDHGLRSSTAIDVTSNRETTRYPSANFPQCAKGSATDRRLFVVLFRQFLVHLPDRLRHNQVDVDPFHFRLRRLHPGQDQVLLFLHGLRPVRAAALVEKIDQLLVECLMSASERRAVETLVNLVGVDLVQFEL